MRIVISNVVFHHANPKEEDDADGTPKRDAGEVGEFDFIIVNGTEEVEVRGSVARVDFSLGEDDWNKFTAKERLGIQAAYDAIRRVIGLRAKE